MPLYKRKPFTLIQKPKDLKPEERVFKVRFTKEIFRDYRDYLNRINLYRKRVWTCKVSGKTNLTYEEALVSEKKFTQIRQFPKEFIVPVLQEVQFSMLRLQDLINLIVEKLQKPLVEGTELYGRRKGHIYLCKISKVLQNDDQTKYEVAWLDKDKKVTGSSFVDGDDLIKRLPFTRIALKSFIKESTYRHAPWVLHVKLAKKYGISSDPPRELKGRISISNGLVVCCKKRKKDEFEEDAEERDKSDVLGSRQSAEKKQKTQLIKYPIDDLLLDQDEDQHLAKRTSPCRDFSVPMDCVGDLLMVWDFCSSFGKLLNLFPFSLEDFESALCHKEGNVVLVVESHSALLRLLLKDNGTFSASTQSKKRKAKITLVTWTDYLCDFLETINIDELSNHISTIKRGHYGLLDIHVKLEILRELVAQSIETDLFREKLEECIEERQALAAKVRGEAIEEGRKRREEKERLKMEPNGKETEKTTVERVEKDSIDDESKDCRQNGNVSAQLNDGKDCRQNGNVSTQVNDDKDCRQNGNVSTQVNDDKDCIQNGNVSTQVNDDKDCRQNGNVSTQVNDDKDCRQNGNVSTQVNDGATTPQQNQSSDNSENEQSDGSLKKKIRNQKEDLKATSEIDLSRKNHKVMMEEKKGANEKTSKEQRKEFLEREIEKRFIRGNCLGKDRNYNRYWFFRRNGRIFVENFDFKEWGYYSTKEELDAFLSSLNEKGERERDLKKQFQNLYDKICAELQKRSKELSQRIAVEEAVLRRSTRVRAPPRDNPALAFLKYENKWKED